MAVWSDTAFVNINSGGSYWTVGAYGSDTWVPATPAGIKENYGFGGVTSIRQTATSGGDQYVKITVPDLGTAWALVFRASATPGSDTTKNGYTVSFGAPYLFFYDNTGTQQFYLSPTLAAVSGTIEGRCIGTTVTVYANGTQIAQFNYSATPSTGLYTGFGAGNNSGVSGVVIAAEGGDLGGTGTVAAQVTGLTATTHDATSIDLGWDTPDNGGLPISGYKIERAPDASGAPGTWTVRVATTASIFTTYRDTGLTTGNIYWYRISAINTAGTGTVSAAASATAAAPPPPAFTDDFSNGLRSWTVARWRSQGSQAGPPINPGYVPPSSNDDGHYDGVLGSHTTPTGVGILPPYDIFVGTGNYLFVGGGSQNYGDTFLRCAQRMDLTGAGPWTIRLGFVPNFNPENNGWSTLFVTDQPQPSPSMTSENSHGPVPQSGFAIRLDAAQYFDGTTNHPAPVTLTYNNFVESSEVTDNAHGLSDVPTNVSVDVVITFTRSHVHMTMNGETWYDLAWTLDTALTSGWVYLGAHNHATVKYTPHSDSRSAAFSYINWDGPALVPQYSYSVADALVPTSGVGEGIGDQVVNPGFHVAGVNVGWLSPTGPLTIPNVPANVNSAKLLLSSKWTPGFPDDGTSYFVRYSLNGHATHDIQTAWKALSGNFAYCSNIDPTELVIGDNTISITLIGQSGSYSPSVGNISLLVESFSIGKIAVGTVTLPSLAIGGTPVRQLAIGTKEIWRAPLPPQVPGLTTLITVLPPGASGQLVARWSQPVDRGSTLTDYVVQYRTSPAGTWTTFTHTAGWARTITITGLANTTAYDVRVAAHNGVGDGAFSNILTMTTTGPATAPAQVTGLSVGTVTTTTVPLSWVAPANGGAAITDYKVEYGTNGTTWPNSVTTGSATASITVTGLTTGTLYYFRVSAHNSVGIGTPSTSITATPTSATSTLVVWGRSGANGVTSTAMAASVTAISPTANSTIVVCVGINAKNNATGATTLALTMTDTIGDTGGGTWTSRATCTRGSTSAGSYFEVTQILTRKVGTSPGTNKTVTATFKRASDNGTTSDDMQMGLQVYEETKTTAAIGVSSGSTGRQANGPTTFNAALTAASTVGSKIFTLCHGDNSPVGGYATPPSGYVYDGAYTGAAWGGAGPFDFAHLVSNPSTGTAVTWTGCDVSNGSSYLGSSLEIK